MSESAGRHPIASLSAYLDGELRDPERSVVAAHLASCASCRALLEDLRVILQASRDEMPPAPPDRLADSVRSSLDREAAPRGFVSRVARHVPLAAAASVLLVVAVALIVRGDLGGLLGPLDQGPRKTAAGKSDADTERFAAPGAGSDEADELAALEEQDAGAARTVPPGEPNGSARGTTQRESAGRSAAEAGVGGEESRTRDEAAAKRAGDQRADTLGSAAAESARRRNQPVIEREEALADDAAEVASGGQPAAADVARKERRPASADAPLMEGSVAAPAPAEPRQEAAADPRAFAKSVEAQRPSRACSVTGVLPAVRVLAWRTTGADDAQAIDREAAEAGLGITVTRTEAAGGQEIAFVVPVENWPAFRAWIAERSSPGPALPTSIENREPPAADCLRLRVEVVAYDLPDR